ncbi:hypothetical protein OG948_59135 (plasmid) [Embleya sp. NBC_00888]|uniref:four-carbon acid sugar kinase family protein n=1 Tax=Embleya sp. NBC_00888 TaxID=2975960 RepID=UPI002F90E9D8|nr:hypothetical protein OG948_59135 [Embleya sp. NBC_00888]
MSRIPPNALITPLSSPPPSLLIVADDLSGAADSAVALAGRADTVVLLDPEAEWPRARVVAIDIDSRHAGPDIAAGRAAAAIRRSAPQTLIYKKMDSTLRGNVGPEIGGCLSALHEREGARHLAVVAPAFPATGRTVVDGQVLIAGEPVQERHPGRRPLVEQLEAAGLRVALLSLAELRDGDPAGTLAAAVGTVDAVVVDAVTDDDLALTVRASANLPVLLVGSGGMAHRLDPLRTDADAASTPAAPAAMTNLSVPGPALVCIGSRSEQAHAQRHALMEELPAVPVEVSTAPGDAARAMREVRSTLAAGYDAVVFPDPALAVRPECAQQFVAALAEVARAGLDTAGALVATGGETARAVLLAIGVHTLEVEGEVEPGVVRLRTPGGLTVITKAGAFGDPGTLLRVTRMLRGRAAATATS